MPARQSPLEVVRVITALDQEIGRQCTSLTDLTDRHNRPARVELSETQQQLLKGYVYGPLNVPGLPLVILAHVDKGVVTHVAVCRPGLHGRT